MSGETARSLIVVRHAKSAWPDVADHERPLADRGRRDAPRAGIWLRDNEAVPERVLCSTACRARETWRLMAGALNSSPPVTYDSRLYDAGPDRLLGVIGETPADVGRLLLVGHFPGVRDLTLRLAGDAVGDALARVGDKFPTCGIAVVLLPGQWAGLRARSGLLLDFAVPRG